MSENGAKNWMVIILPSHALGLKKGPLSWDDALALMEEERNAGMLPLLDYVPVEDAQPQTWRDVALDQPVHDD